jgi:hypothetical protein
MTARLGTTLLIFLIALPALAQDEAPQMIPAPDRAEGDGPYDRLIIRGATLIDGTGAPAHHRSGQSTSSSRATALPT